MNASFLAKDELVNIHRRKITEILNQYDRTNAIEQLTSYVVGKIGMVLSYERRKCRLCLYEREQHGKNKIQTR